MGHPTFWTAKQVLLQIPDDIPMVKVVVSWNMVKGSVFCDMCYPEPWSDRMVLYMT